jgi:metal-responsive CopG/Arc/MetJ family transcriptional regulator
MNSQNTVLVRASISFPPDLYETLEKIAKQKKVSLAWVVREASERYVADETGKSGNRRNQTRKPTRRSI